MAKGDQSEVNAMCYDASEYWQHLKRDREIMRGKGGWKDKCREFTPAVLAMLFC